MRRSITSAHAGVSLLVLAVCPAAAQTLSPQEVFRRVAPSLVVVEVKEYPEKGKPRLIGSGSGVVIPSREKDVTVVVTNCHVIDKAPYGVVGLTAGELNGLGWVAGKDTARDLCVVHALFYGSDAKGTPLMDDKGEVAYTKLPAVQVGSSQWLQVGDPVYALGAPQGLELSLSSGLVSGFREHKGGEYIQTTAPISKGSSGGGLFDAQGRLVGITTMYITDGQALNFAVPAELIASVPRTDNDRKTGRGSDTSSSDPAQAAAAASLDTPEEGAGSSRWWIFYEDDGREVAFDTETIHKSGPAVTVWERARFEEPQRSASGKMYVEDMTRATYYCGSRQKSYDQFTFRDAEGTVVANVQLKSWEVTRRDMMPETIGEAMYEAACSL